MIETWQIIVLALFAGLSYVDAMSFMTGAYHNVVLTGFITGIVMGDIQLGLIIGGTFQMLALGMAAIGGSSIPEYRSATILVVAIAAVSGGMDVAQEYVVTFGIPVAALTIQLDVLAKMVNSFFQGKIDKAVEIGDTKSILKFNSLGAVSLFMGRFIPVFLGLLIGPSLAVLLQQYTPLWLVDGFKIAGGMLPIVGFVVLLRYLPTKGNTHFVLLGFILSAYFGLNTTGVALMGIVVAIIIYQNSEKSLNMVSVASINEFEGDDYDE